MIPQNVSTRNTPTPQISGENSKFLETALYYANAGWHIFPLKAREKTPRTPNGLHDATTDPDTIRGWWQRWPDANIGVNAGASGLLVLDFDTGKDVYAGGELLDALRADFPTTTARTGSGGFHLLYRQPDGEALGNRRGKLPKGIDVRGVGGYIVVAPSVHPNGGEYRWLTFPAQTSPRPLPEFVRELVTAQDEPTQTARVDNPAALGLGDQELLDKAMNAQSNGAQFRSLWSGDLSTAGGDHSSADQALCNLLAFWTGKDEARMDRLFRQSGLYRPKWEREDYRRGTLQSALKGVRNVYDPSKANDMSDATRAAMGAVGMSTGQTNGAGPHTNGTNGTGPKTSGANGTNGTNGAGGTGPQSGPVDPLGELLSELVAVEDDRAAVMRWALDNVAALAGLAEAEFAILCLELKARGVTEKWLTGDLRRAVDGERKDQTTGPIWTDYIQAAAKLGYHFRLNVLGDTLEVNGAPMTDVYAAVLLSKLHAQGLKNANVAQRAFLTEADRRRFHPVKEYLEGLTWDGQDHIAALAGYFTDTHDPITYGDGTQRTVFHAFLRRWLVGAVAKVYNPIEAQNPMLILDGEQGKGKSFFAKWLCPLADLHFEGAIRPDDKDYLRYLATKWIWEVGELGATMRKADREALKEFITKQDITVRVAFGHYPLQKPALASFIGTVNFDGALLADPTGHRRFWPVNLSAIDWGYSQTVDVAQLWAQAFALYKAGETWKLSTAERAAHAAITEAYEVEDVLGEYILQHFTVNPANDALYTHTTEIVDKLRNIAQLRGSDRAVAMQIASSLNKLGLKKAKRRDATGNLRWGYTGIKPIVPIP